MKEYVQISSSIYDNIFLKCENHNRCVIAAVCCSFGTILSEFVHCMESARTHAINDGLLHIATILDENIQEELGQSEYDSNLLEKYRIEMNLVNNVSHRELLDVFVKSIREQLTKEEQDTASKIESKLYHTAQKWKNVYVNESNKSLANALGAMCYGCELVLPALFQELITLIRLQFPNVCDDGLAYLYIHVFVDVEHGKVLSSIANSICRQDEKKRRDIMTSLQHVKEASDHFWAEALLQNISSTGI